MQQVMWETDFNRQFEQIVVRYGVDQSDSAKIKFLKNRLNINQRRSCQLMVEVDENWKQKLTQLLEQDHLVQQER